MIAKIVTVASILLAGCGTAASVPGNISTVTDPLGRAYGVTYDGDDAPTLLQYPNGTETTYAYDARHRVTDIAAVQTATSTLQAALNPPAPPPAA